MDHEVLDDAVEGRSLVSEALLPSSEGTEVLSRLGNSLSIETKDNAAERFIAVLDVEVDLVGNLGALCSCRRLGEQDQPDSKKEHGGRQEASKVEHCAVLRMVHKANRQLVLELGVEERRVGLSGTKDTCTYGTAGPREVH